VADSVYRVTEVVGTSSESWEAAARTAVETAGKSLRDLRVAEVVRQDVTIENGHVSGFRVRLNISFKYESGDCRRLAASGREPTARRFSLLGAPQAHFRGEISP
jgi:flavin-binding protein dodecin